MQSSQAKVVSQQIVDDIENDRGRRSSPRFDGKGFCFMEVGNKKAGYVAADFYNEQGPATLLEPPSEESYKKKIDFERSKLDGVVISIVPPMFCVKRIETTLSLLLIYK